MMAQNDFFEHLARRTIGSGTSIVPRPAITPETLPETFVTSSDGLYRSVASKSSWRALVTQSYSENSSKPRALGGAKSKDEDMLRAEQEGEEEDGDKTPPAKIPSQPTDSKSEKVSPMRSPLYASYRTGDNKHAPLSQKEMIHHNDDEYSSTNNDDVPDPIHVPHQMGVKPPTHQPVSDRVVRPSNVKAEKDGLPALQDQEESIAGNPPIFPKHKNKGELSVNKDISIVAEPATAAEENVSPVLHSKETALVKPLSVRQISSIQQEQAEIRPAVTSGQGKTIAPWGDDDNDNTITIHIGKIEVRAVLPQKPASSTKQQNTISLSEYLKMRAEGRL